MGPPRQASDPQAIDIGAHTPVVRRALRRLGVPPELLDDAVQDVFTVVVRREGDFDRGRSLVNWLWGIARGVASTHRRALGRRARLHAALATTDDDGSTAEDALARAEASAKVAAFVERLPAGMREVFVLAHLQGYSGPEIAARLGINLNTAYARVRTTRIRLEAELLAEPPASLGARILRAFAPMFTASTTSIATVGMTASLVWLGARAPRPADVEIDDVVAIDRVVPADARPSLRTARLRRSAPSAAIVPALAPVIEAELEPATEGRPRSPAMIAPPRSPRVAAPAVPAAPVDAPAALVADAPRTAPLLLPDGVHVAAGAPVEFPSLVAARGDFVPELVRVAADL